MEYGDYKAVRQFIQEKASALMKYERKNYAKVGFPPQNYRIYPIAGRTFYSVSTNIFRLLLSEVLPEAIDIFPLNFGGGNAVSVIHALNKTEYLSGRTKDAIRILQNENCCYIVENDNGKVPDKILRIDLFRKLDKIKNKRRKYDFTGGVFHALKHFSYHGKPLSTGDKGLTDLTSPFDIVEFATKAFFVESGEFVDANTFVSKFSINEKHNLKFVFYHETNTSVFFIKTIHIDPK